MSNEPTNPHEAMREAAKRISTEAAAALDLYVLEQGPLQIEYDEQGAKFVATQAVRLRLKEAEEIRADERAAIRARVEAAHNWQRGTDPSDRALWLSDALAAIDGPDVQDGEATP